MSEGGPLEAVYATHYAAIRRYVARLVGDAEAEDVTQEAFVKALRSAGKLHDSDSLRPWLYRVATNAALDRLRSPARARRSGLPFDEERLLVECRSMERPPQASVEAEAIRGEMSACVRPIVDRLPEGQRLILLLSEFEGLTDAEIAQVVGASLGSVKIRLHRARARLRQEIDASCRIYPDSQNEISCDPVVPVSSISGRR